MLHRLQSINFVILILYVFGVHMESSKVQEQSLLPHCPERPLLSDILSGLKSICLLKL